VSLAAGTKLGPYEILVPIGAGGMGEVYRARDQRLKRDVAVKVLPSTYSTDADRLRRFEQEAQTAGGLNHPNITAVHDLGNHDGSPYIVTELLEGETLRARLSGGAIPVRKATDYAVQVAHGLAAAHEKGIVHRDLKPENLFVTNDGRVKILDFGLAKLTQVEGVAGPQTNLPTDAGTEPGVVLGTLGYMSPEQVKGKPADARSDIFAFGVILYEMLSGSRAFHRDTAAETMSAILREDPPDLSATNKNVQPGLERVVRHCLEKNPEERFHSAHDLAFDLQALSGSTSSTTAVTPAPARKVSISKAALAIAGVLALGLAGATFLFGRRTVHSEPPSFKQLTFRRGHVDTARFAPDGKTFLYTAAWEGKPMEIFVGQPDGPGARPAGLAGAQLLAISSSGELAVSLNPIAITAFEHRGTLAQVPAAGGAPREILKDVESADWSPDGKSLAVVRAGANGARLEYPVGKVLYETHGWMAQVRVSPDGERVAFIDHPTPADDGGAVAQVDRAGKKTTLSKPFASLYGLAWSPDGAEVWFTAAEAGVNRALYSARSGRERIRVRIPGNLVLHDIARDGRMLVARDSLRNEIMALAPGESKERDLTWFDWSVPSVISRDGRTVLFSEAGEGGGSGYSVFLRKTDGSPAVRLGEGNSQDISPDGQWVLALQNPAKPKLVAYPTGAGEPKPFPMDKAIVLTATFMPDGKRIYFTAIEEGHGPRIYLRDFAGGPPRALTPEGYSSSGVASPDGKQIAVRGPDRRRYLYPVEGGEPTPIPGTEPGDAILQFGAGGGHLFTQAGNDIPVTVTRVDLATGKKEPWRTVVPGDPAGVSNLFVIPVPDGSAYMYSFARSLSELFLLQNVP